MDSPFQLLAGDCLESLRGMPDNSIDSIVTDPPYGLSFMGKKWDYDVPGGDVWAECLRVLKPGGHLLAFAGTRTQHRMAVRIEDAGFEIRDMIAWVYGSGFPKSLDVSKAIDKAAGAERTEVVGRYQPPGMDKPWNLKNAEDQRGVDVFASSRNNLDILSPVTDAARQWQGWGTALKPALEPITVARKPLVGTVAANVLQHSTGALNIDGCRVETTDNLNGGAYAENGGRNTSTSLSASGMNVPGKTVGSEFVQPSGRWPANLIHDGSDEVVAAFPQASGAVAPVRGTEASAKTDNAYGDFAGRAPSDQRDGGGSAARFFYCAKASRKDRNEGLEDPGPQFKRGTTLRQVENTDTTGNTHPTVKPTELMRYLVRLVTPPGGVVLDPFMGSGSTGKAALREGFRFIGCELSPEYLEIARARICHAQSATKERKDWANAEPQQALPLFDEVSA